MDLEEGWRVRCLDDEPIYCEAPHDEAEVLYAGSDDEHYDDPNERKSRYEEAAIRFLRGHTPVLLTTALRGPFEGPDAKGWVNPWQSRKKPAPVASATKSPPEPVLKITSDPEPESLDAQNDGSPTSCHLPSPQSLDQVDITPHPFLEEEDLERVESWRSTAESTSRMEEAAWPFDASLSQSQRRSQRKRRSAGSEWLKRDDSKRRKGGRTHDLEQPSAATPQRNIPSLRRELSDPRTRSQQKQEDTITEAEAGKESLESPEASSSSPPKASQAVTTRSSQRLLSQAYDKRNSSPEIPAPLSTPIQTPQSSRKSRMTPGRATPESGPRSSGVATVERGACGGDEFETQQDESFLFRARPRERVPGIMQSKPRRLISFAQVSPLSSTSSSETDSHDELLDLDGDTCMADDTKATCSDSNAEDNEHLGESPKKDTEQVAEQAMKSELENDGYLSEHSSEKSATGYTEDTLVDATQTPVGGLKQLEITRSSLSNGQVIVAEVMTDGLGQEKTVHGHSVSQEGQDNESTNDVGCTPLPLTPANRLPVPTQSATQPSTSQNSAVPTALPQSPWSKLSQFTTSSPASRPDEGREHSGDVEADIGRGTLTYDASITPSTAGVERDLTSDSTNPNRQSEDGPLRIRGNARIEEMISQGDSPVVPASQQSPWKADVPAMAPPQQQRLATQGGDGGFMDPGCQSPWTASPGIMRQAAQEALMSNILNVARPVSSSPLAPPAFTNSDTLVVKCTSDLDPQEAAAAETVSSSSPEPVFCIKSFAKFMSPSPEKPRRRSTKIRLSDGHLPSTQNLIAATTDNPWDSVPKSPKRVRWAPLPHENDSGEDRCPQTPTGPRASSPPPETAVADLPTGEDDEYKNHFQAVSRRKKLHHHLLPSASQQFLESPAPMAMAEAFVAADSFKAPPGPDVSMCIGETPSLPKNTESQESTLDDVDDVLRNLNEFIEMVDVEADLARTKEEEQKAAERRQQEQQQSQKLGGAFASGLNFDGMMDAGVWD